MKYFSAIFILFLGSMVVFLRAAPPMFEEKSAFSDSQNIVNNTLLHQRQINRFSDSDEEEESIDLQQRGILLEEMERQLPVSNNNAFSDEDNGITDPTCQPTLSNSRMSFVEQIRNAWNRLPSLCRSSSSQSMVVPPDIHNQQGNLEGVTIVPIEGGRQQQPPLKSGMKKTNLGNLQRDKPKSTITFQQVEGEKKLIDTDTERDSFPGQEEIENYLVAFAQIQQTLQNKIRAVNAQKLARVTELQEELSRLRQEDILKTVRRREEIKKELKALKKEQETDPEKLIQIAQLYDEAYPQVRELIQQMLTWLQEHPEYQHEQTADLLAKMTIKLAEIASKVAAVPTIEPIKKISLAQFASQRPIEPPYKITALEAYEEWTLPKKDLQHELIITGINHVFQNLQDFKKVLDPKNQTAGESLKEARIGQAKRATKLSYDQEDYIRNTRILLKNMPVKERDKSLIKESFKQSNIQRAISENLCQKEQEIRNSIPVTNSGDAKKAAAVEALSLIQPGLQVIDEFVMMLKERKK